MDLPQFIGFRIKVSSTIVFPVNTMDGPRTMSSRFFIEECLSFSVTGGFLAVVDIWEQFFARFGKIHWSFNMSIPLMWWNWTNFCIVSSVGTTSLFLHQRRKSFEGTHVFLLLHTGQVLIVFLSSCRRLLQFQSRQGFFRWQAPIY